MSKRPSSRYNDPGYLYNQKRLLKLFALTSALMLIGILAMIWVDFDRPWKDEQRAGMRWEARRMALEERILAILEQGDRRELARQRARARKAIEAKQDELEAIREQLKSARGDFEGADSAYKEQKQYTTEAEYRVHEAKTEAELAEWTRRLREARDKEHRLRDATQLAKAELDRLLAAEKAILQALDDVFAAERKDPGVKRMQILSQNIEKKRAYSPLREIPLLDFLAPPTKVEQVVLDYLVDNYEFATPKKVDRCGTCHISAMRQGFEADTWPVEIVPEDARDPKRLEEAIYRFVFDLMDAIEPRVEKDDPYRREEELLREERIHHNALDFLFRDYDRDTGAIGLDKEKRKVWKRYRFDEEKKRWVSTRKGGHSVDEYFWALLKRMEGHWRTHPHFDDMVGDNSPHPYGRFGCTSCHQGRGWSVDFGFAYHTPDRVPTDDWMTTERAHEEGHHLPLSADRSLEEAMAMGNAVPTGSETGPYPVHTGWVEDDETGHHWEEELGWDHHKRHYWLWPQLPKKLVQSSCLKCHTEGLYETPATEYADVRLGKPDPAVPDLASWRQHAKRYFDDPEAEAAGEYAGRIFLPREKEAYRPTSLERGLDGFLRFGCYGCHKLDSKAYPFMETVRPRGAPQLDDIAAKTSRDFLLKWVRNPKDYRFETRMPRFWGLSNNSHDFRFRFAEGGDDQVDGQAWSDAEVHAIVTWLMHESDRRGTAFPEVDLTKGDPRRGAQIVVGDYKSSEARAKACIACHEVPVPDDLKYNAAAMAAWTDKDTRKTYGWKERMSRRQGPDLAGIGSKVKPGWLYSWLKSPRGYWHDTNMPDLRLTDQEALDLTAYLMTLRSEDFEALPGVGYNASILAKIAQELKVSEQQESTEVALSIAKRWSEKERELYVGKKLFKHYGCFGCHEVEAFKDATPIGTEITEWGSKLIDRLEFNHAPIQHTRFDFAYTKLINPRIYDHGMPRADRPYERLRMPRFAFTADEAFDLTTFLLGLVNDPIPDQSLFSPDAREKDIIRGRQVVRRYNCQGCHIIEDKGGDVWPVIADRKWQPPNLLGQGLKTTPDWLFRFMKDPAFVTIPGVPNSDRVRPWHSIRMPSYHLTDEEARAIVRYFAALSGETADFETPAPDSLTGPGTQYARPKRLTVKDPADQTKQVTITVRNRLQEAEGLFVEYACKSCHSSDESVPIGNQAPNFRHTRAGRLREAWLSKWLWGPYKLQPGTAMPAFFEDEDEEGRKIPLAQAKQFFAEDPSRQPDEQIRALRDFIRHHYSEDD